MTSLHTPDVPKLGRLHAIYGSDLGRGYIYMRNARSDSSCHEVRGGDHGHMRIIFPMLGSPTLLLQIAQMWISVFDVCCVDTVAQ